MSDEDAATRAAQQKAQEGREAALVSARIIALRLHPIAGKFDADHLKAIHAHIFQDLPHHKPGIIRDDTAQSWIKHRALEGRSGVHEVHYASQGVEAKITDILRAFDGPQAIKGLTPEAAADRMAQLYGDLDHAHGFYEGNSRTLREFTRELASNAGYTLDWIKTGVGPKERNQLYIARDLAVMERAFPGLDSERAMKTNDRAEYEAFYVIEGLRRAAGDKTLATIIRDSLRPARQRQQQQEEQEPQRADRDEAASSEASQGSHEPKKASDYLRERGRFRDRGRER